MSDAEYKFFCEYCGSKFKTDKGLKNHSNRDRKCYEKWECDRCHQEFDRKFNYDRHISRKFPCIDDNPGNICEICNGSYSSKSYLKKHLIKCREKHKDTPED